MITEDEARALVRGHQRRLYHEAVDFHKYQIKAKTRRAWVKEVLRTILKLPTFQILYVDVEGQAKKLKITVLGLATHGNFDGRTVLLDETLHGRYEFLMLEINARKFAVYKVDTRLFVTRHAIERTVERTGSRNVRAVLHSLAMVCIDLLMSVDERQPGRHRFLTPSGWRIVIQQDPDDTIAVLTTLPPRANGRAD